MCFSYYMNEFYSLSRDRSPVEQLRSSVSRRRVTFSLPDPVVRPTMHTIMPPLLKIALEQQRYDLAAHIIVFGLLKAATHHDKKGKGKKTRVLQPGA